MTRIYHLLFALLTSTLLAAQGGSILFGARQSVEIENLAEAIEDESCDTMIIKLSALTYDTLSIRKSPVFKKELAPDSAYVLIRSNEKGIRSLLVNDTYYYFDDKELIKTFYYCSSMAHMGLCNGLFSEYHNYFIKGRYQKTLEGNGTGQCPCADNVILDLESIERIFAKFEESD